MTTVGKLFTPTVPSEAESCLNQLTPGIASTSVVTGQVVYLSRHRSTLLFVLNWWINQVQAGYGQGKGGRHSLC